MFDINIITMGKVKNEFFAGACEEYLKRLKPFASVKFLELAPIAFDESNREKTKKEEGEKIMTALEKFSNAKIYLLHERGKEVDSMKFASDLDQSAGKVVFVIAGALGFSEEILEKYPQLSLAKMTFPHEMARLILLEQIYRAASIVNGKTYHY